MFSGQSRCLVRRIICQNLIDGPVVRGNEIVLSSEFERSHHNNSCPGGTDQNGQEENKNPKQGCNYCPFLLTKNLFEYIGIAGVCFLIGSDVKQDVRSSFLRRQLLASTEPESPFLPKESESSFLSKEPENPSLPKESWKDVIIRTFVGKIADISFATVLPKNAKKETSGSSHSARVTKEDFIAIATDASNHMNNMIGVALLEAGEVEGLKFLEQCSNYGKSYYNLGVAYENGQVSGEPDYEKARTYYQKGAELENKGAVFNLAILYINGKGIEKDMSQGRRLLEKARKMGVPQADEYIKQLHDSQLTMTLLKPENVKSLHSSSSAPNIISWKREMERETSSRDLYKDDHDSTPLSVGVN